MARIYKVWTDERCPDGEEEIYTDEEKLAEFLWTEDDIPEEWFVESVNDIYEPVELGSYRWTPAEVLKKMDPKAWEEDYALFVRAEMDDHQREAADTLMGMQPGEQIQENGFTIRCEDAAKKDKTLMETLVDAGYPADQFGHHESDLYVYAEVDGLFTREIIGKWFFDRGYAPSLFVDAFTDQITGRRMWDVAFQYTPWWAEHCGKEKTNETQS